MDIQNNSITADEDMKIHSVILKPNCYDWGDITKFRKTKAVQVTAFTLPKDKKLVGGDNSYVPQKEEIKFRSDVSTWASLVRATVSFLKRNYINNFIFTCGYTDFEAKYTKAIDKVLSVTDSQPNVNFYVGLYEDDNYINSSVYMNNKNHKLQICKDGEGNDKYVCAVYTGEIIWVLKALLDVISEYLKEEPDDLYIRIDYIDRKELIDDEQLEMSECEIAGSNKSSVKDNLESLKIKLTVAYVEATQLQQYLYDICKSLDVPSLEQLKNSIDNYKKE